MEPQHVADIGYVNWKSNVPLTYDWLTHSHLLWPSLSMCWGGVVGFATPTVTTAEAGVEEEPMMHAATLRSVYYATRTGAMQGGWSDHSSPRGRRCLNVGLLTLEGDPATHTLRGPCGCHSGTRAPPWHNLFGSPILGAGTGCSACSVAGWALPSGCAREVGAVGWWALHCHPALTPTHTPCVAADETFDERTGRWSGTPSYLTVADLEVPPPHSVKARGLGW
jgi:hypothetical protein